MQAQQRRNAIRRSWVLTLSKAPQPVDVKFVLAQPNTSSIADAHQLLQVHFAMPTSSVMLLLFCDMRFMHHDMTVYMNMYAQAEVHHQDILFVRNMEMYNNLPKKTLSIMRYASKALPR